MTVEARKDMAEELERVWQKFERLFSVNERKAYRADPRTG